MTRRLIREGDPPSGQLASPVPQYWNPSTEAFEDVLGAHGAPRAILYGPNGQPISQSNPLEVRVRELEAELAAMRGMLETGNAKVTLTGSNVALPVDLQYHDLETPLPVSIANQTSDAVRIVKEYIGVSPGATSLYLGQSPYTTGATVMKLLDVSQYRTIAVYVHNRTGATLHFRAFAFSHLAETHFENGAVMGVWQQSAITISDGEQRYITLHDADKIAELAWFGHVPLPYFGFQLRLVPGETFGEDRAVDAAVIGVVR